MYIYVYAYVFKYLDLYELFRHAWAMPMMNQAAVVCVCVFWYAWTMSMQNKINLDCTSVYVHVYRDMYEPCVRRQEETNPLVCPCMYVHVCVRVCICLFWYARTMFILYIHTYAFIHTYKLAALLPLYIYRGRYIIYDIWIVMSLKVCMHVCIYVCIYI